MLIARRRVVKFDGSDFRILPSSLSIPAEMLLNISVFKSAISPASKSCSSLSKELYHSLRICNSFSVHFPWLYFSNNFWYSLMFGFLVMGRGGNFFTPPSVYSQLSVCRVLSGSCKRSEERRVGK